MKVISQDTFDSVVLENIQDFDYTLSDAIEEAVKEFEAQGVQLSNIVKNLKLNEDNSNVVHSILESLSGIKECTSDETILEHLKTFTSECKFSLAHRVLATKNDAFLILINRIGNFESKPNVLGAIIFALAALTDTNSDILNSSGIEAMVRLFKAYQNNLHYSIVSEALCRWCYESCLKHEQNRQSLVAAGAMGHISTILFQHKSNANVVKAACKASRAFVLDDDIRTEFGNAHEHARSLVEEHGMIKISLETVKDYLKDSVITSELLSTVSRLCVRAEYCQNAVDNGALLVINDILVSFPDDAALNKQTINLLRTICGNDKVKEEVMKVGAADLIIAALAKHHNSAGVCEAALGALSFLALRTPNYAKQLGEKGATEKIVQAMKLHSTERQIQKIGCMAVRNLAVRVPENCVILKECEAEAVIHAAMEQFGADVMDLAKAALRDLGMDVKLVEQWKGTGGEIER